MKNILILGMFFISSLNAIEIKKIPPKKYSLITENKLKEIEVAGNSVVSYGKIIELIQDEDGSIPDDLIKIKARLSKSGYFKTIEVNRKSGKLHIKLIEEPVISEYQIVSQGIYLLEKKPIFDAMNIKKGDILTRDKLHYAIEVLKQSCAISTNISNVQVRVDKSIQKGNKVNLIFRVRVIKPRKAKRAIFSGNKQLTSRELFRNLSRVPVTSHPVPFVTFTELNQFDYSQHKINLERYANNKGFFDFEVTDINLSRDCFNISVQEGNRYKIAKIEIDSECIEVDKQKISRFLATIKVGNFYSKQSIVMALQRLKDYFFKLGINFYKVEEIKEKISTSEVAIKIKIYKDPNAFKIRSIRIKNNDKYRESVIRDRLNLQSGDYISPDILRMQESKVEELDAILSCEARVIDLKNSSSKDLEINVNESKEKMSFELLYAATTSKLEGNFGTNNFTGTGISAMVNINSLDSVLLGVTIPNNKNGIVYSFKVNVGAESISSQLFESASLIDYLHNEMFGYRYKSASEASSAFTDDLPTSLTAERHSFGEFDKIKFGPNWKDDAKLLRGSYIALTASCTIPLHQNDQVGFGVTFKNRSFEYPRHSFSVQDYRIKRPHLGKTKDQNILKLRAKEYVDRTSKGQVVSWESLSDEDKVELYNSGSGEDLSIEEIRSLSPYKQQRIASDGSLKRIYRGMPSNRFLEPILREKLELITSMEYKKAFLLEDFNNSTFDFFIRAATIFGTTNALKLHLGCNYGIKLSHSLNLDLNLLLGTAVNSNYLDNFTADDIGVCQSMGPIELYNFIPLGGKLMSRATASLNYKIEIDSPLVFYPNLSFTIASLSNSGYEPKRMPENLLKKRGWPKDTIDIAQNDLSLIGILSPGIRMRCGFLIFGMAANFKVYDPHPKYNILRPVNFEIGFKMGD